MKDFTLSPIGTYLKLPGEDSKASAYSCDRRRIKTAVLFIDPIYSKASTLSLANGQS